MTAAQEDSPDAGPDGDRSAPGLRSSLNANFSRLPRSRRSSRGKETAHHSGTNPSLSSSRARPSRLPSRLPLDVLHGVCDPLPSSHNILRGLSDPHQQLRGHPFIAETRTSDTISPHSTSTRRTHSVYRNDETADGHTETPPKRLKLSFTLGGSPTVSDRSERPAPSRLSLDANSSTPSDSYSLDNRPLTSIEADVCGIGTDLPAGEVELASSMPGLGDHDPSSAAFLRLQPPLMPYRPRGLSDLSNIRSTLKPALTFELDESIHSIATSRVQPLDTTVPTERTTPEPQTDSLIRYHLRNELDLDDDDGSTLSLDEHASLPSPRLSPVSATNGAVSPVSSSREYPVSTLCLSRQTTWMEPHEWERWNVGALKPHQVQISGRPLECSHNYTALMDWFSKLSSEAQAFVFSQMLSKSSVHVLRYAADTAELALKMDVLAGLPIELSRQVISHLDFRSLCQVAQVSKQWRNIADTDEDAWHNAMARDGFKIPPGELERAVREGWGWQDPYGPDGYEVDLSDSVFAPLNPQTFSSLASSSKSGLNTSFLPDTNTSPRLSNSLRRKKVFAQAGGPRLRRWCDPNSIDLSMLIKKFGNQCPPFTYARAARIQVPNPNLGLPSLRCMHLFKSLYRRHHLIRHSWLKPETKPYHLAFHVQHRHVITCLQFDSEKILTGSDNTNIHVYDTQSGERLSSLPGHSGGVWALQYTGNTLVSGSTDRSVRIWDIEKARCLHTFQGHTSTVRCLLILHPTRVGENADGTPLMMPSQPLIVTGSRDSTIRIWKLPQPGDRSLFQSSPPVNETDNPYFVRVLTGHEHSVRAIAAHGDTLVSGSYDFTVRVWQISTGRCLHLLTGHTNKVYSVVLDHRHNRCISGSMDNLVKIWSIDTGECLHNLKGHTNLVGLLDLNQNLLVSAAADSTLRVWDPDSGRCLSTLSSHSGTITCFQHDGYKAISGGDKTLKMWDIRSGQCVGDLLTNLSAVWQVRFDDRRCVAAVQRNANTYIEVLDFGASRDGVPANRRGVRILVDKNGIPINDPDETEDALATPVA